VQRHDAAVAVITFVLTITRAPHLDKGIMVGVMLSLMLFLYRSMAPHVAVLSRDPDGTLRDADVRKLQTCRNISLIRFDGPCLQVRCVRTAGPGHRVRASGRAVRNA